MYYKTFGLSEPPFQLTPDSRYFFLSDIHTRAKAYMDYAVWKRDGFIVLTGEIGAGKTTLINKLLSEIGPDVELIRVFQTQLNEIEFLQAMLFEVGVSNKEIHGQGKVELLHRLNDYLIKIYAKGKHAVLIIDEGQNLSKKVLEEIRMLSGLELDREKLLNIILVGQPEMNQVLDQPSMTQLVQRIRLRFHLGPLNQSETVNYIHHRLSVADCKEPKSVFSPDAIKIIYEFTGGIPRKINILCDTALVCAYADNKTSVDKRSVNDAIAELQWKKYSKENVKIHVDHQKVIDNSKSIHHGGKNLQIPDFTAGPDQWADMFSSLIKVMGDTTERMQSIENKIQIMQPQLSRIEDMLEALTSNKKVYSLMEKKNIEGKK